MGPSGCGKSTTLRLLAGLDPASSGQILLGDDDITTTPPADRGVALVFQSYALYPHLSVERNLSLGPELRGTRPELMKERSTESSNCCSSKTCATANPLGSRRPKAARCPRARPLAAAALDAAR